MVNALKKKVHEFIYGKVYRLDRGAKLVLPAFLTKRATNTYECLLLKAFKLLPYL